ncbi:MAG: DNA methyltransferase [Candidatus Micrarchaeota archaeon]
MRKKDAVEKIDYAIIAQAHTPMYLIHKYWARKPHNVVSEYIKHYSKEGEIVLDPFGGSGVTAMEAIKSNRKAVSIDLNPISEFIIENTLIQVDKKDIIDQLKIIENNVKEKIIRNYETPCPKCNSRSLILASIWNREKNIPFEMRGYCSLCDKKYAIKPTNKDIDLIKSIDKKTGKWAPTARLAYNGSEFKEGTHRKNLSTIDSLFTRRNLICLSEIFEEINKITDKKLRSVFQFAFTSMVHLASKMCPVAKEGGRGHWSALSATSFWPVHRYWIPPIFMESNVWMLFESSVIGKQGILNGKEDAASQITNFKRAKNFQDLNDGANILFETRNALELTKSVPPNSIDYIFTDPPYGGAIQYFELSTLWASWLKMDLDYEDEITVNEQQKKDFGYYHKMLRSAFREMYQVLKPGRYLTVTFHSTEIAVWNSIIKAVVLNGFDLEKIVYQPPARASAKGLLQPYGSAVGDYYIRFKKPDAEKLSSESTMDLETYDREVVQAATFIIAERGEPAIYQRILNGIMVELKGGRNVPIGARNIEQVLKEHVGKEFELIDVHDTKGKKAGKAWWLKGKDFTNFSTPSLSDRVEKVVLNVLDKKIKASFDDVLQEIFIHFPNALTPDTEDIASILEEYAVKTPDGNWRLKPELQEGQRESIHNTMIFYLAQLGRKAGYKVWIGLQEQKFKVNNTLLSQICDEIPTFRYVPQDSSTLDRIKQIDVLWLEDGKIRYEFEVETTTGISEAIIRGSNIPQELNPKRYIIIPKDREKFLFRKLQEPILAQAIKKTKWNFIRYSDLERIAKSAKKAFKASELENVAKLPRETGDETQTNLANYGQ